MFRKLIESLLEYRRGILEARYQSLYMREGELMFCKKCHSSELTLVGKKREEVEHNTFFTFTHRCNHCNTDTLEVKSVVTKRGK